MRALSFVILICSLSTASPQIVFDDGKPPSKERSPELEALNFSTGRWVSEYVLRQTPEAKEFRGKGIAIAQWSPNGQFLISDGWLLMKAPDSPTNFWGAVLRVTTWDPIRKEYRITEISPTLTTTMSMTLEGKRSTTRSEFRDADHVTKTTTYAERISDTEIKFRAESSLDGGPIWVYSEGTTTRVSN
jgi:hypothetical protein